jgi:predicted nucleotidyltransferase
VDHEGKAVNGAYRKKMLKNLTSHSRSKQNSLMSIAFNRAKKVLTSNREHLLHLGARRLAIFGSTARHENTKTSDIDILVDFDPKKGLFGFADLKFFLQDILHCDVDLVSKRALHPALKKRILSEARQIF